MTTSCSDDLLTKGALAARLNVKPATVAKWTREGRIPSRRLSPKVVRYDLAAVLSALETPRPADGRGGGPMTTPDRAGAAPGAVAPHGATADPIAWFRELVNARDTRTALGAQRELRRLGWSVVRLKPRPDRKGVAR